MKKLGTILEEAGVIDEIQLVRALSHQRKWRCRLGKSLIELGFVDETTIAKTVAKQLGIPYREFNPAETPAELLELIPENIARERMLFPVGYSTLPGGKAVMVVMSDPTDENTLKELEKVTVIRIDPAVGVDGAIEDAVNAWERLKTSNPRSKSEDLIASAHKSIDKRLGADEEEILEGAEIVDEEWPEEETAAGSSPGAPAPQKVERTEPPPIIPHSPPTPASPPPQHRSSPDQAAGKYQAVGPM